MSEQDGVALLEPAASRVEDPLSGKSILLVGLVQNARMDSGRLRFDLVFTPDHLRDVRRNIEVALLNEIKKAGFTGDVFPFVRTDGKSVPAPKVKQPDAVPGMTGAGMGAHGGPVERQRLPGVKHIVAVASGKGGVGKSTVSTNLAIALQRLGHKVGLLDADIYGPSLPTMMNVHASPMVNDVDQMMPVNSYGVRCLSVGMMVPNDQAIIWRGPMVMSLVRQFLQQADWDGIDYLIIDLPPGTGDAQLTLIQAVELSGSVIVTTPQKVALADAVRGLSMFKKLDVPVIGLVENMAWYELPNGDRDYIFGKGGGVALAQSYGTEVLGQIPLVTSLRKSGDQGLPAALGDDSISQIFTSIAQHVADALPLNE